MTPTDTYTYTPTNTFTITNTPTITYTPTITPTPNIDISLNRNYADVTKGEKVQIQIKTIAGRQVHVRVYNLTGEYIKEFDFTAVIDGWTNVEWDVRNRAGKVVGRGMYFIHIKVEGLPQAIRRIYIVK